MNIKHPSRRRSAPGVALAALGLLPILTAFTACNGGGPIDNDPETDTSGMACNDALIEATHDVRARYPTFGVAKTARSVSNFDYREAHTKKELSGFGVTLVTMTSVATVQNWTGNINEPSLLFFEKIDSLPASDWPLIGFGYHHEWDDDEPMGRCTRPTPDCTTASSFDDNFIIHEAGYHISGFLVADPNDIKNGRGPLDAAGCTLIDHNDVRDADLFDEGVGAKHGRSWTMHVWISPNGQFPMISTVDPWQRDGGNGWEFTVAGNAFYPQGECDCPDSPARLLSTTPGPGTSLALRDSEVTERAVRQSSNSVEPLRINPVDGVRITMLSWTSPLEQLGVRANDVVERVITLGAVTSSVALTSFDDLDTALSNVRALEPGDIFWIQIVRDGERQYLAFTNGDG